VRLIPALLVYVNSSHVGGCKEENADALRRVFLPEAKKNTAELISRAIIIPIRQLRQISLTDIQSLSST
jgi:hypothetical protein